MHTASRFALAALTAFAAAACGSGTRDDGYSRTTADTPTTTTYDTTPTNTTYDVNVDDVVDVAPETYSSRTYFFEPNDTTHVYWYEANNPEVWHYRPYYRDHDRAYFVERDGRSVRRIQFDERRARSFDWNHEKRWDTNARERMQERARTDWQSREHEEHDWRNRFEQKHRDHLVR